MFKWTREAADRESAPAPGGEQDRTVLRRRALMRAVEQRSRDQGLSPAATTAAVNDAMKRADKECGRG